MTQSVPSVLSAGNGPGRDRAATVDPSDGHVLHALAGGTTQPTARFEYDASTETWWWSPEMYALHGLDPNRVTPSTELLLSHKHNEDRSQTEDTLRGVLATGEPFCCRHRIIDASGRTRTVLSLGEGICDEAGNVTTVFGYFVDLTASLQRDIERETREAVARSSETRAAIEQAKGLLVAAFRITPNAAFDLLCWYSQQTNTKVRVLADRLVETFVQAPADGITPARRVKELFNGLARPDTEEPG